MGITKFILALLCTLALAGLAFAGNEPAPEKAPAEGAKGVPQTLCPVSGDKIDKAQFVDYAGKRIYFCCNKCPAAFNKEPEKYLKRMAEANIVLEDSPKAVPQTLCPVMDKNKIDKTQFVDYAGKRIYFCCGMCPAEFKKDPEKYLKKLAEQNVILENAPPAEKK